MFVSLSKKRPYSELFWSLFRISCIWVECGETLRISSYSVCMRENADQNIFEYRHFLRSVWLQNPKNYFTYKKTVR